METPPLLLIEWLYGQPLRLPLPPMATARVRPYQKMRLLRNVWSVSVSHWGHVVTLAVVLPLKRLKSLLRPLLRSPIMPLGSSFGMSPTRDGCLVNSLTI